jgi:hypothetical protein
MIIQGRTFEFVVAGDVLTRDGLGVELWETVGDEPLCIAEVFRSDDDNSYTFSGYAEDVPLQAIERLLERARERLMSASEPL